MLGRVLLMVQVLQLSTLVSSEGATTITKGSEVLINSRVLPGNLLPNFYNSEQRVESGPKIKLGAGRGAPAFTIPDDSCESDIFADLNLDLRSPQLPNLSQDLWTCDRKEEEIEHFVYENDALRVLINPQFGGRVSSIFDKRAGRENLFRNQAHQPALIGALKAWTSGGLEWNYSPGVIGHSAFTESQVFMASVESEAGPVVRLYEFDRLNATVWQVDLLLYNSTLLAHPKLTNPSEVDLRGYWWTCMAVPSTPGTRVITPATSVAETSRLPVGSSPWPIFAEAIENASFAAQFRDNSYLGAYPSSGDFFLLMPRDQVVTPFIGHAKEKDGYTFIHGHNLNGTKFFTWGVSGPGRFMQDFLAGGKERQGDYTELQVGVAPTQLQTFAMPAGSSREWTEWFKGTGDALSSETVHYSDYAAMIRAMSAWIASPEGAPPDHIAQLDSMLGRLSDQPVREADVLARGSPWGALEEMLLGRQLAPGLFFSLPSPGEPGYDEAQAWVELLKTGTFSSQTLDRLPLSFQTSDRWMAKILAAPSNWLQSLHAGIGMMERGDGTSAKSFFELSMTQKLNPLAARCLAILSSNYPDAIVGYKSAWAILTAKPFTTDASFSRLVLNLAAEMALVFTQASSYDDMRWLLSALSNYQEARGLDPVLRLEATLLVHDQRYDEAMTLLSSNCFPTFATDRTSLMTLWTSAVEKRAGAMTELEKHVARIETPIPRNIGCNKGSKYCLNYW